jgi:hypothetical protein
MFRKVTLALVAAASLCVMALALSPTAASAKPLMIWNPNPHFHHHWHPGFGIGFLAGGYDGCYRGTPGADAVRLPPAYRQRLRLLIGHCPAQTPVARAAGFSVSRIATTSGTPADAAKA